MYKVCRRNTPCSKQILQPIKYHKKFVHLTFVLSMLNVRTESMPSFNKPKDLWLPIILIQKQLYPSNRLWSQDTTTYRCVKYPRIHSHWRFFLGPTSWAQGQTRGITPAAANIPWDRGRGKLDPGKGASSSLHQLGYGLCILLSQPFNAVHLHR